MGGASQSRIAGVLWVTAKTATGIRLLPLLPLISEALLTQRHKKGEQRAATGATWQEAGYVFTTRSAP
jgi:hypothetical protein